MRSAKAPCKKRFSGATNATHTNRRFIYEIEENRPRLWVVAASIRHEKSEPLPGDGVEVVSGALVMERPRQKDENASGVTACEKVVHRDGKTGRRQARQGGG